MFLLQQIVAERSRPSYKNNLTCGNSSRISLNSSCFRNTNCTPTTKKKRSFLPKTSSSCANTNGTNDLPFLYLVNLRIIHVALCLLLFFSSLLLVFVPALPCADRLLMRRLLSYATASAIPYTHLANVAIKQTLKEKKKRTFNIVSIGFHTWPYPDFCHSGWPCRAQMPFSDEPTQPDDVP